MLTAPFTGAVDDLRLLCDAALPARVVGERASVAIAGLAAAIVAGAQIAGGLLVPHLRRLFRRRTVVLLCGTIVSVAVLAIIGLAPRFWVVITLLSLWGLMFAALTPVRQSYLNALIESKQRATVLSFDSLLGSSGAAGASAGSREGGGRLGLSSLISPTAAIQALALPFYWLAVRERTAADAMDES